MARGGQNRKPRQSKIIQGTFRKDRNPVQEPDPPPVPEVPKPPTGLNRWARREWKRLAAELANQGLLTALDLASLEVCVVAFGTYKECADAIRKAGGLAKYLGEKGQNSHTRPLFSAMRHSWATYKSYLVEFGLSPVSRNRIEAPKRSADAEDVMQRLFNEP